MKRIRTIRLAADDDFPRILQLIEYGRQKMRMMGNIEQWSDGNSKRELLVEDISRGYSYVVEEGGVAVATFAFIEGPDITYKNIYNGKWVDDERPYFVVHRMASMLGVHGVFNDVLDYCFRHTDNIRIDTHRQNHLMRHALEKYGFDYCGIIYLLDGAERLAYQKTTITPYI